MAKSYLELSHRVIGSGASTNTKLINTKMSKTGSSGNILRGPEDGNEAGDSDTCPSSSHVGGQGMGITASSEPDRATVVRPVSKI